LEGFNEALAKPQVHGERNAYFPLTPALSLGEREEHVRPLG
jgi:hypothetical protein